MVFDESNINKNKWNTIKKKLFGMVLRFEPEVSPTVRLRVPTAIHTLLAGHSHQATFLCAFYTEGNYF